MPRKLLTAIDQINERMMQTVITVNRGQQQALLLRQLHTQLTTLKTQREAYPFLNVQRLMFLMRLREYAVLAPFMIPRERVTTLTTALKPLWELEELRRKRVLPYRKILELEFERRQRVTPQLTEEEQKLTRLHEFSIILLEQYLIALIEEFLLLKYGLTVLEVLEKIMEMCMYKRQYALTVPRFEHLLKLLLELYVTAFMAQPETLNLLAIRCTPLTMTLMKHKNASIYAVASVQKRATKQKALLKSCEKRKPEVRLLSGSRTRAPATAIKRLLGTTEDLTEETKISVGKDYFGRDFWFWVLRYAYGIPYWIRRVMAMELGMPENYKLIRYFKLAVIPSRRARKAWKKERFYERLPILYHRDGWKGIMDVYKKYHPVPHGRKRIFRKFTLPPYATPP